MLPPGHIAAGYLTVRVALHIFQPGLSTSDVDNLVFWGAFFGFAPDLDFFYTFLKAGRCTVHKSDPSHRKYWSHAPILWLIAGFSMWFLAASEYVRWIGLLLWFGSWSHFIVDTLDRHGVMWAWPFSSYTYTVRPGDTIFDTFDITETRFFRNWLKVVSYYMQTAALSFVLEIVLVIAAIIIFLHYP